MTKPYVNRHLLWCSFLLCISIVFSFQSVSASSNANPTNGTTYYVNANSGNDNNSGLSESNAFRTLNHISERTDPGDTVLVMNGTYRESNTAKATLRILEEHGGTADNWVTFKAYPGHSPRIQSNGYWFAVDIRAQYVIIDGFEVRGIRDEVSYQEALDSYNAMRYDGADGNPRVQGHGITTRSYNIIRNNDVHNFGSTGIEISDDQVIVENNRVYNTSAHSPNGTSGISVIYPTNFGDRNRGLEGTKYKIIIRGNTVYDNENLFRCSCYEYRQVTDGHGIIIDLAEEYQGWTLISNNVAFDNGGYGIHTYRTRNIDIVNNTVYKNGQSDDIRGDLIVSRSENVNVVNNIIYAVNGVKLTSSNDGTNIRYLHNIYYDGSDSPELQTPLGTGDIIANPRLRNPSLNPDNADFRLSSNSPGIDSGNDDFLPDSDIRGAPRYEGSGDRGAYENRNVPTSATALGDVNCSGGVDSVDALLVLQYDVEQRSNSGECPLSDPDSQLNATVGDVNNDGRVNSVDALLMLQCSVNISNVFCTQGGQLNADVIQAAENSAVKLYLPYME